MIIRAYIASQKKIKNKKTVSKFLFLHFLSALGRRSGSDFDEAVVQISREGPHEKRDEHDEERELYARDDPQRAFY